MKTLMIDCSYSGVAGDMLLSALAPIVGIKKLQQYLNTIIESLPRIKHHTLRFEDRLSHGISGTFLHLDLNELSELEGKMHLAALPVTGVSMLSPKKPSHGAHHHHSHYSGIQLKEDLTKALELQSISAQAKNTAVGILTNIIEAEAAVHGMPLDQVHLHEIGAVDTILDIAGVAFALDILGVFRSDNPTAVFVTPIAVGGGTVKTAHGMLPVPAPASAKILEKFHLPHRFGPVDFELATPTGISIIAGLSQLENVSFGRPSGVFSLLKEGTGVGSKEFHEQANMLKIKYVDLAYSEKSSEVVPVDWQTEKVVLLETNVDDVRGEILGDLMSLLLEQGALDVNMYPSITKKNRPGHLISVLVNETKVNDISALLFERLGTLGIRINRLDRIILERKIVTEKVIINSKIGERTYDVPIKMGFFNGKIANRKIEFDFLAKLATKLGQSVQEVEKQIWASLSGTFL